jgi:putative oxidoreductase
MINKEFILQKNLNLLITKKLIMKNNDKQLQLSLFLLRISIFLVMFMWTIQKFVDPEHAIKIYEGFYYIVGLESIVMYAIGVVEMIILLFFLVGYKKKYTYGAVLILHAISTLSSFKQYLAPFEGPHLLFFAAWPMLAACVALFLLHDQDKKFCIR